MNTTFIRWLVFFCSLKLQLLSYYSLACSSNNLYGYSWLNPNLKVYILFFRMENKPPSKYAFTGIYNFYIPKCMLISHGNIYNFLTHLSAIYLPHFVLNREKTKTSHQFGDTKNPCLLHGIQALTYATNFTFFAVYICVCCLCAWVRREVKHLKVYTGLCLSIAVFVEQRILWHVFAYFLLLLFYPACFISH